jgi:hypothetical protein
MPAAVARTAVSVFHRQARLKIANSGNFSSAHFSGRNFLFSA